MAEKRQPSKTICVKNNAKIEQKIELFRAEQWQDGPVGCYRVRVNRKWHQPADGRLYCTEAAVLRLVGELSLGHAPALPDMPDIPRGSRVSVPNGIVVDGEQRYDGTFTSTPPIRGYGGEWYVGVLLPGQGFHFVRADTVVVHRRK